MAAECVDGQMATPHITGAQKGALHAGVFGTDSRVLAVGNQLKAIQNSATSVTIQTGEAVVHGRHCEVTSATTVTIASGTQGQKRNDLICLRYSRASTGIESCDLVVLKGNATTGTAADPSVPSGNVLNGDAQDYFPLYRVSLNGTTAAAPVQLFKVSPTLASLGDSVSRYSTTPVTVGYWIDGSPVKRVVLKLGAVSSGTSSTMAFGFKCSRIVSLCVTRSNGSVPYIPMESGSANAFAWGVSFSASSDGVTISCGSSNNFPGGYAVVEYVE